MRIREHWLFFTVLVAVAFGVIAGGMLWGYTELKNIPDPGWYLSEPAQPTLEPTFTPAPIKPTCAPGEKWSNYASKCYIPKPAAAGNRIDAIPSAKCD